jgi:hypothetical protein
MTRLAFNQGDLATTTREGAPAELSDLKPPTLLDQSITANQPISSDVSIIVTDAPGVLLVTATHKKSASEIPTASALLSFAGKDGVFSELESNDSESALHVRDAVMEIIDLGVKQLRLLGVEKISLKDCPSSVSGVVQAMGFGKCADSGSMIFGKGKS